MTDTSNPDNIPFAMPFNEALDFFKRKKRLPAAHWADIWQQQHDKAYINAGAMQAQIYTSIHQALVTSMQQGTGYDAFKADFAKIAADNGWSYNGGLGWRANVVYTTNMQQSYNAGRHVQMQAIKNLRPYWRYCHNAAVKDPRPEHKAWHGLVLSADDAWWQTHSPQNGWGCRCYVQSLTKEQAQMHFDAQNDGKPDTAPPLDWQDKTLKIAGVQQTVSVPRGIDAGFAYAPGAADWAEPYVPTQYPLHTKLDITRRKPRAAVNADLPVPTPSVADAGKIMSKGKPAEDYVQAFLAQFGAKIGQGAVFTDASGTPLVVSDKLFKAGVNKATYKWDDAQEKADRLPYALLLADALLTPDEVWVSFEQSGSSLGKSLLVRRLLKIFEVDGEKKYAVVSFTLSDRKLWEGGTAIFLDHSGADEYFNVQRIGTLAYKK